MVADVGITSLVCGSADHEWIVGTQKTHLAVAGPSV
jgi:hypothetical protein